MLRLYMGYYQCCHLTGDQAVIKAEAYCKQHGLRWTEFRSKMLKLIWDSSKALTAHEIMAETRRHQPPMTYRNLEFLTEHGFIHHIGSLNAYIGSHQIGTKCGGKLLICTCCKEVKEVEVEECLMSINKAAKHEDFHINQMKVEVLGLCKDCHKHMTS